LYGHVITLLHGQMTLEAHAFQKQVDWLKASLQQLDVKGSTGFLFDWGGYFGLRALIDSE